MVVVCLLALAGPAGATSAGSWRGVLRSQANAAVPNATVRLHSAVHNHDYASRTSPQGEFYFDEIAPGDYQVSVESQGTSCRLPGTLNFQAGLALAAGLQLCSPGQALRVVNAEPSASDVSGGEHLSSEQVSTLPLNARDFSQLLLLASGTMTDTNGAANFTQQFAVNGQRGSTTVFAMDGIDTTDPEMGGATFSNFNVEAIQEVRSSSGVMPAEIGHGAAGFTDIITRKGTDNLHGSVFEFLRNSALDARNFFDKRSPVSPGRIPPFARNEFGFTLGGPFVIPGLYNGSKRTYFFGQYEGFRQVLGTTQVLSVPSLEERQGMDTTAFPGDTLLVPLNSQ